MTHVLRNKIDKYIITDLIEKGYTAFDMHFHSHYSMDSVAKLDIVLKKAHYDRIGVAITDHNQFKGSFKACDNKFRVPIIPGIETTTRKGVHTLYYFFDKYELKAFFKKELAPKLKNNPFFADIDAEELMKRSEKYKCIVGMPHPFVPGTTGMMKIEITSYMKKRISVIEGLNAYNLTNNNTRAIEMAKKMKKPLSAGSDGHSVFELGTAITFLKGNSINEYLHSLLKGNTIISGKEESFFLKFIMAIEKEETYLHKAFQQHGSIKLVESQFMTEYKYYTRNFKKKGNHLSQLLKHHHY